jgi:L-alanine-DL-glutamate epimerase-like enolase superfamily enzyme
VLGEEIASAADIARITRRDRHRSLDMLQADHTLSGIDIALWDLLGQMRDQPAWALVGDGGNHAKTPYASVLFGDTPQETLAKGRAAVAAGYSAVKFGWGPFGAGTAQADADQIVAAREGIGPDALLLVDAGTIWVDDLARARLSLPALKAANATWLEEPFVSGALAGYAALAAEAAPVRMAGGEGAHHPHMAMHMIDHAGIGFVQIDAGRIGGITSARDVALYARDRGVTYVNHTFTSHLALAASLVPFADLADHVICEYPVEPKALAIEATHDHILRDANGQVRLPDRPGLGITPDLDACRRYLKQVEIVVDGKVLYRTPELRA